jgi:hypothetical protein
MGQLAAILLSRNTGVQQTRPQSVAGELR